LAHFQVIGTWDIEIGDETVPMEHARSFDCGLAAPKGPVLKVAPSSGCPNRASECIARFDLCGTERTSLSQAFQTKRTLTVKLDLPYIATASDGTKGYWCVIFSATRNLRTPCTACPEFGFARRESWGSPLPHLHRDRLDSPLPHLHRD
jgi:hypothetical protein